MPIVNNESITQREVQEYEWQKEMFDKNAELKIKLKELEIKHLMVESKITSWFKIPVTIVKLPVYMLFGVGYCINAIRKIEPSENFWKFIK